MVRRNIPCYAPAFPPQSDTSQKVRVMTQSTSRSQLEPQHPNLDAVDAALAQARHPAVADFLVYYRSIHPQNALPARSRFNPMAIPRLLPHLVLAEVEYPQGPEAPGRFRIKVAGDEVTRSLGISMHGRYLDEIANSERPSMRFPIADRQIVAETGRLIYRIGQPRVQFSLDFADIELVHCPLAEDGVTVSHVVSVFHYNGASAER